MSKIRLLTIACFALVITCSNGFAQQIPPESLDKLQDTFSLLRDNLWEQNDNFWHRGEYKRCIAMCRLITQIDPHEVEAYDDAAWLMQNDFKDDEAEIFLLEGLKNNRDRYDLYFDLGYFCYMHERFDEAVNYLEEASYFDPPAFAKHLLAHAYELAGRYDDAFSIWIEAEALDPSDQVPSNQITRMMNGGPASNLPHDAARWRKERKASEMNSH